MTQPNAKTKILLIAADPAQSPVTGWPIGFWWAELTHAWHAFNEAGYQVDIVSPNGGDLQGDGYSDPRDESGYSAHDIVSLGFISSPSHLALTKGVAALASVDPDQYDAVFVAGGQSPMVTMIDDQAVHDFIAAFHATGKPTALVCHGTCILLKARGGDGELLVKGKTWTGFADSEEMYAEQATGSKIQPFWIETEARQIEGTNFITSVPFSAFAVRDGNLITGQQQNSSAAAARLVIEALGK